MSACAVKAKRDKEGIRVRDQIIDGYLKDFVEEQSLKGFSPSDTFERFASVASVN